MSNIHQYDVDKNINSHLRHQELLSSSYNTPCIQLVVQSKTTRSLSPNPGPYTNTTPEYSLHPHPYRKYSRDDVALSMLMSKWMSNIVVPSIGNVCCAYPADIPIDRRILWGSLVANVGNLHNSTHKRNSDSVVIANAHTSLFLYELNIRNPAKNTIYEVVASNLENMPAEKYACHQISW